MNLQQLIDTGFVEHYDVDGQTGIRATKLGVDECAIGGPNAEDIMAVLS